MRSQKLFLLILNTLALANLCISEFVPVYMWGTHSTSEPVPALQKISQSSFKDEIESILKETQRIVVFAEPSLSPEDFGQRDGSGNTAFPYLSKVRKTSKVTYLSNVQNPIKASRHASKDVADISIEKLNENFDIPEARIVIIDLNDAKENEHRFEMLKRHDKLMASIYENLLQKHSHLLALYTAYHASWIESGEIHSRRTRSLFAVDINETNQYFDNSTIMFYTSANVTIIKDNEVIEFPVTYNIGENSRSNSSVILIGNAISNNRNLSISFHFVRYTTGYWYMQNALINFDNVSLNQVTNATIYAPLGFSYTCGNQTFKNANFSASFADFQVQPALFKSTYMTRNTKFDDPYNCIGFTTIPIWSGLFVTLILLMIMTFGLTMMMDIKTMDRFDDAKGKTITINASE